MPSTITWTGAVSGDMSTAGNYSGGAVPVAGDTLQFITNGTNAPDTNLGALSGVALARVIRASTFTQPLGTAGTSIGLRATRADWVVPAGVSDYVSFNGSLFNCSSLGNGSLLKLTTVTTSAELRLSKGNGYTIRSGSLFGDVYLKDATVVIESGCTHAANKSVYGKGFTVKSSTTLVAVNGEGMVELTGCGISGRVVLTDRLKVKALGSGGTLADVVNLAESSVALITQQCTGLTITALRFLTANSHDIPDNDWRVTIGSSTKIDLGVFE